MTANKEDNFTTLVGVKWTHESMLQVHQTMWETYVSKLLNSKRISKKEKNKKIDLIYEWFNLIHNLCINKELAIKKK